MHRQRSLIAALIAALVALWVVPASAQAEQVLTWTADNGVTSYKSAPATATAGPATIVFENSLATGNTTGMPHTLTFDTSTPGYNHDVALDIIANPFDASGGRHQAQVTLSPGKYRYFCAIPGHGQMVGELVVTDGGGGDTTPPTVTASVTGDRDAEGNYRGAATVTVSAADEGSGVDTIEYNLDGGPFTAYTEPVLVNTVGSHMVHYRATDVAGNVSAEGMVSFTVVEDADTTAPTVSATVTGNQDAAGDYVGSATVTVSAEDAGSGVASVEYEIDDTGFRPYTGPVTVTAVGDHAVQYRATDAAGNVSETGSVAFTVVEPVEEDTTAPAVSAAVSGNQDGSGAYIERATVTVTASDEQSGVASVEYELDGAAWMAYTAPVSVAAVGEHTVRYRATDGAGNVSSIGTVTFAVVEPAPVDTTPPTVSAVVSGERNDTGAYVGSALVTVTAEDVESGVAGVEYNLDGGPFVAYTEPVLVNAVGSHMVHFRATDNAGNTSGEGMVAFTVAAPPVEDTTPPEVVAVVSGEQDASGAYVGSASVTVTATDAGTGVDTVEYNLDGGPFMAYTGPVVVNAVGSHMVHFRATDLAGNTSAEGMVAFTVVEPAEEDTTAPTVAAVVSGNQDGTGAYIDSATVTITAEDTHSGVATIEYSTGGEWAAYTGPLTIGEAGEHTVRYRATDVAGNVSEPATVTFTVVDPGTDDCADSDTRATVIIDGDDTGVANVDTGHGCTVNDLIAETATYANHGAFVTHVDRVTAALVADGVLTKQDRTRIVRAAARSNIGKA
ncbi:OmpL47-type beta-barrel domain-containing protein [Actinokineospora fastidiosa]|uniref:Blue (type 1) copper domain-containing protein n=2 Tax=Actinokineospora fastidiosa TaxID=1816 RepID=A0A918GT42_9PSEU|nr:plastocyanin/azurin family copper-binding protein [Actinokineospora fastidiosa]GGS60208.1 hypothetical protein GCM10010171_63970 [Actinokineospora fastidiosa]